jgi:hypothetical protein
MAAPMTKTAPVVVPKKSSRKSASALKEERKAVDIANPLDANLKLILRGKKFVNAFLKFKRAKAAEAKSQAIMEEIKLGLATAMGPAIEAEIEGTGMIFYRGIAKKEAYTVDAQEYRCAEFRKSKS